MLYIVITRQITTLELFNKNIASLSQLTSVPGACSVHGITCFAINQNKETIFSAGSEVLRKKKSPPDGIYNEMFPIRFCRTVTVTSSIWCLVSLSRGHFDAIVVVWIEVSVSSQILFNTMLNVFSIEIKLPIRGKRHKILASWNPPILGMIYRNSLNITGS